MQKSKIEKFSIFNFLDVKLKFLMSRVELTQFSVESSRVELKIWATQLKSSWKCEQLDSILIWVQNVNLKLDSMINLDIKKSCILIMMFEKYVYDVSDDDRLSQRRRSFENEKKLSVIFEELLFKLMIFFDHMNYRLCNKVKC